MMKTNPEIGFNIVTSTVEVIRFPNAIAMPSTIKNAKKTPKKMFLYFCVLAESNRMETCVLSPNSAIAIARKGMIMSSKIVLTVDLIYSAIRIFLVGKYLLVS